MNNNREEEEAINYAQEQRELAELGQYVETVSEEVEEFSKREVTTYGKQLPAVVEEYVQAAVKVSNGNYIPASIAFFTTLGQIVKDFIHIPYGQGREDTRIHFCWIQTSGTGKSTLWNFVGPVADRTFELINKRSSDESLNFTHPPLITNSSEETVLKSMPRVFDIFGLTDYTDAVLIGGYSKEKEAGLAEDAPPIWVDKRNAGKLEGNGLAHWDEFEYSGIFSQSQHQEKAIVYLNTLMNSLVGESWIISKALVSYENKVMECYCERSIFAMTYPPENLNEVIAQKGVMQRMLLYVKNIDKETQHQMRLEQISKAGIIEETNAPIDKYAKALYKLYTTTQERYEEVGGNPLKTVTYGPSFNKALKLSYFHMKEDLLGTRLEVDTLADNFTTRMTKTLTRMAVLCCVAESPSIKDKSLRFIVDGHHVEQAERIIRQCYISLVRWLDQSLAHKKVSITGKSYNTEFKRVFNKMDKDEDGFVNKTIYLAEVMKDIKKSKAQVYRIYSDLKPVNIFEEIKFGKSPYIRLIKRTKKNKKGDEE